MQPNYNTTSAHDESVSVIPANATDKEALMALALGVHPKQYILKLLSAGMSYADIAEMLSSKGVTVSKAWVAERARAWFIRTVSYEVRS